MRIFKSSYRDREGKKRKTAKWYCELRDHLRTVRRFPAFTDRKESETLGRQIEKLVACKIAGEAPGPELSRWLEGLPSVFRERLARVNLIDCTRAAAGKSLSKHIAEYTDHLAKKERGQAYINEVAGMLTRIFQDCGFSTWSDLSAARLKHYLDGLRDGGKGISKRRYNGLLGVTKSFCRWMVRQQKATNSPIEYLDGLDNQQTDSRHPRRVLGLNDFRRFCEAALRGPTIYGMDGYTRNLLYRFSAETGLRSVDIRRLRKQDFDFKEQKITISAGRIKNKTSSTVYLKPATALAIEQYCATKLPNADVFHLTDKTSLMVKFDLANTVVKDADGNEIVPAIPYVENGEYFDYHSLRYQCASLLAMNPDTPEAVRQQALRHKTPKMTRHYSHTFEDQQREAINALPDLTQPSRESQASVKTGTDNVTTPR